MNIRKEADVQATSGVTGEDLRLINRLTRREVKAEEVYTFAVRLCDNDVDRDGEKFARETLEELGTLFVGVSGVFDHQWSAKGQTARIYRTELVDEAGEFTADGEPYCYLKGYAYMMRTGENEGLIAEIDGGIKREVSVGCAVSRVECSVCGEDMTDRGRCTHEKGERYGGKVCCGVLLGATDAYEWSFVAVPAQKKAGVVKSARIRDELEKEAEVGRRYLKSLRRDVVRLCCLVQPGAEKDLMERVAQRLGEEELEGLRKLYQMEADRLLLPESQLCPGEKSWDKEQSHGAFCI